MTRTRIQTTRLNSFVKTELQYRLIGHKTCFGKALWHTATEIYGYQPATEAELIAQRQAEKKQRHKEILETVNALIR